VKYRSKDREQWREREGKKAIETRKESEKWEM